MGKITKRAVDGTNSSTRDAFLWDTQVKGFGLKVTPNGKKVYVLQYRVTGRQTPKRLHFGQAINHYPRLVVASRNDSGWRRLRIAASQIPLKPRRKYCVNIDVVGILFI